VRVSGNLPGVDVGDPLPAFALVDTEGKTWDSTALKGNIAVLSYFATF
jgi:peroxiredoxin